MTEVDFVDLTCEDKHTFEISEIGYKVQVLTTQINDKKRSTAKFYFASGRCKEVLNMLQIIEGDLSHPFHPAGMVSRCFILHFGPSCPF